MRGKGGEQWPEAVKAWLENRYPAIEQRARAEGAEMRWGDEIAPVDVRGRSYVPKRQTPVTYAVGSTREKPSMISTLTNQDKTRWIIIDDAFDADRLIAR